MNYALRAAQVEDITALLAIEGACFPDPWSETSLHEAIAGERNFACIAHHEAEIWGYATAWALFDEGEITRIAVLSSQRGQGIGMALLQALFAESERRGVKTVFLEVRSGNDAARRLYERAGFAACGVRRAYYADGEDALIMRQSVGK